MADAKALLDGLKDALISSVKEDAEKFLSDNKDAAAFLEAQAKDLAELGIEYAKVGAGAAGDKVLFEIKIVQQTIKNKLSGIAVDAEAAARAAFIGKMEILGQVLLKVAPVIISAI